MFVVFPHALSQLPLPQLWAVIFFAMLVCLGIDSQFAMVEVVITSVKDSFETYFFKGNFQAITIFSNNNSIAKFLVMYFVTCFPQNYQFL